MAQKVLISYEEYQTLKSYKEKYVDLKKKMVLSDENFERPMKQSDSDQKGHGSNISGELENNIVRNENTLDQAPMTLLESQTVPETVKDITKPIPSMQAPEATAESKESDSDPWYFLGIPKMVWECEQEISSRSFQNIAL